MLFSLNYTEEIPTPDPKYFFPHFTPYALMYPQMPNTNDTDIVNLLEALNYQDKSVISSVLLKNSGGTITLFAFDEGEGLSEHKTPYDAFLNVVEGSARIRIAERDHSLNAGDSIVLPANIPHAVDALTKFKMLLVMIKVPG
jgi:quercetin dioxygenase-like cupin family protein